MPRFIVVRAGNRVIRIPTHFCQHCTDTTICSVCNAKAEEARALLAAEQSRTS